MGSRGRRSGQATTNASVESISGHRSKGTSSSSACVLWARIASTLRSYDARDVDARPDRAVRDAARHERLGRVHGFEPALAQELVEAVEIALRDRAVEQPRERRSARRRPQRAERLGRDLADRDVVLVPRDAVRAERHHDLGLGGREQVANLGHERLARHPAQTAVGVPQEPEVGFEPEGAPRGEVLGLADARERLAGRERRVGDAAGVAARGQDHGELEVVVRVEREAPGHPEGVVVRMREDARDPSHATTAAAGGRAAARARS